MSIAVQSLDAYPQSDLRGYAARSTRALKRFLPALLLSAITPFSAAQTIGIAWAGQGALPASGSAPGIVGSPDSFVEGNSTWRATQFTGPVLYGALAQTIGLSQSQLARYDVMAWEANAGSPAASGGWESSSWVFSAGGASVATAFNEVTGLGTHPDVSFLTGSITGAQYNSLFGTSVPQAEVWSWLIAKLPAGMDARAASFSVDFAAVGGLAGWGEGSPDPDAIGVLSSVPEPGTWALMAIGVAALCWRRSTRPSAAVLEA